MYRRSIRASFNKTHLHTSVYDPPPTLRINLLIKRIYIAIILNLTFHKQLKFYIFINYNSGVQPLSIKKAPPQMVELLL